MFALPRFPCDRGMREKIGESDCRGIAHAAVAIGSADHKRESIGDPLALNQSFARSRSCPNCIGRLSEAGKQSKALCDLGERLWSVRQLVAD